MCVGVLSVGLGPGLDSMSPARSRRFASHAAGTHGRLPQKTGRPGLIIIIVSSNFPIPLFCTFVSYILELKKGIQCVEMYQEKIL